MKGRFMRVLGVIPARKGSRGIPDKNLQPVLGRPLIGYVFEAAKRSKLLDRLIVSTDSDRIAHLAEKEGIEVPFMRPDVLAGDDVSLIPVMIHAMNHFNAAGWKPDVVVSIQPTSPLHEAEDIDQAIRLVLETGCDSAVSVSEILHGHPFRAMRLQGDRVLPLTEYTSDRYLQKQDRPKAFAFTGGIYARRSYLLEDWNGNDFALGRAVKAVLIEPERAIDIDHPVDLAVFESILRNRLMSLSPAVSSEGCL
jgi:CMP-N-acetylneuraminic acid synthetase